MFGCIYDGYMKRYLIIYIDLLRKRYNHNHYGWPGFSSQCIFADLNIPWWANWGWIFNLQTEAVMLLAFLPIWTASVQIGKNNSWCLHIQTIKHVFIVVYMKLNSSTTFCFPLFFVLRSHQSTPSPSRSSKSSWLMRIWLRLTSEIHNFETSQLRNYAPAQTHILCKMDGCKTTRKRLISLENYDEN